MLAGGKVRRADADTVKKATGYTIGGVPPFGHDTALRLWIDEDLLGHDLIYAAGGVPECIFPLTPEELLKATGGTVADVRESKSPKGERT
jgi:prolyl-tRNA editing enzyme YbaK/EbsC (Cys-tRNA(Pro) deacylase)